MTKRTKLTLLAVAVAAMVVVAAKTTYDAVAPASRVYVPPSWEGLTPEQRERRLDDEERRRRMSGRGPARRLPEDRPPATRP